MLVNSTQPTKSGFGTSAPALPEAQSDFDKYKLLVNSIQDYAIFLMDENGYIRTWNKGAERNKGYKESEIVGKHFSIFYTDEDRRARKPEKELVIAKKYGRAEDEDWRLRKDGSKFWASVVITALYDNSNTLIGFAKVTRDLTERKQHEDELRQANILLKTQQEELRLLNQSKDEFISLASHQLRTPATAIKQLLGILVEGFEQDLSERQLKIVKKAYENNERQINIVNSLLKVAQVDAGKVSLEYNVFNAYELVGDIVDNFRASAKARQQKIYFGANDRSILISADKQNLRMAIENIISNAIKYTYLGGTVRVSLSEEGGKIRITTKDTGVGIAENDMRHLFEKFKRIPNNLSEEVGGSGLGLYWSQRIIQLHAGSIDVESETGKGSQFTIILPKGC